MIGFLLVSPFNFEVIKIVFLGAMLMSFAYSFNDYCEGRQRKKYFITPLITSFLILPLYNYLQISFSLIALIIATLYSLKPISLRERPFVVTVANAVAVPILFLLGYFYVPLLELTGLGISFLLFCFVMVGQVFHEVTHIKEDKKDKIVTTAIFLGEEKIKYFCQIFLFLSAILAYVLFSINIVNIIFLFSTIIFVVFIAFQINKKSINYNLRKIYVNSCVVLGLIYILSFYL